MVAGDADVVDRDDVGVIEAGALGGGSIQQYTLRAPRDHIHRVRQLAIEDAISRANHLASALGLTLGQVTVIGESSSDPSSLMLYGEGAHLLVAASVTITFELQ